MRKLLVLSRFNSTTVQLIHSRTYNEATNAMFQFHNGTINTYYEILLLHLSYVSIPQRYN